jgi:hypothetical protein
MSGRPGGPELERHCQPSNLTEAPWARLWTTSKSLRSGHHDPRHADQRVHQHLSTAFSGYNDARGVSG